MLAPFRASPRKSEKPRSQSRARVRYNAALKVIRKVHMFVGLFMAPWVFLYGVTGFLFNHPDAFPDRAVRTAGRSDLSGTALEAFPTAPELAERVVSALNAERGTQRFTLVDRAGATYSRPILVTATGEGREHSVRFDPETGESFIRSTILAGGRGASPTWPAARTLRLADSPRDRLAQGIPALLEKQGIEADATEIRNPPSLLCTIDHAGRRWRATYNLQSGAVTALLANDPRAQLSTRLFLTRMHLAYTYPGQIDARWLWAVAVDVMSGAMVLWGITGLLMWWQMKKLRFWGMATVILSLATATMLAVGMHAVLASRV
jgi:hypothetical protein